MKAIHIILICLSLSSCVTRRACDRKFPSTEKDSVREVINTVSTYRDTTIFIKIQGDTVYRENILREGNVSKLNTSLAISEAWVSNGKLKHRLTQKDTIIPKTLKSALKTTLTASEKEKVVYRVRKVNELTNWQWVQVWAGRVFMLLFVAAILIKGLRINWF
ncbi:MAG TPA: hypothetical protein VK212_03505 [Lentimicrobium sp.]|nr:hypothetical protein [Lentimicrobium sp.]